MVILLIACLIGVSLYLAMRLSAASAENTTLRSQVASLKKQLRKNRP
jgi:hypothetical protein